MVSDDRRHHQIVWIQYGYIFFKYAKMGAATKLFDLKKETKKRVCFAYVGDRSVFSLRDTALQHEV